MYIFDEMIMFDLMLYVYKVYLFFFTQCKSATNKQTILLCLFYYFMYYKLLSIEDKARFNPNVRQPNLHYL